MNGTTPGHAPPETADALVGRTVDKYRVLRLVGRGGMGAVYEALNTAINKRVAMKCIDAELAANPEAVARFQREALAASAVESPNIVQIFDAGTAPGGTPYIVMELLRGRDLGKCLAALGRLELSETLAVVSQVLRGLHRAHAVGIVHRDLKPDNVFLVEREDEPLLAKILDFGVSKIAHSSDVPLKTLTRQGTIVGTPYYMAPEQAQGFADVDHRADLYSVGAIVYECLAGRPPHIGTSYEQVIVNICMRDAEDVRQHAPAVPEAVAAVIAKALARERSERYGSARELGDALVAAAPETLRARFASSPSGLMRLSLGADELAALGPAPTPSGPGAADVIGRAAASEPGVAGEQARASGAAPTSPLPSAPGVAGSAPEPPGAEARQAMLAETVRADSGITSVATPPGEPETPMKVGPKRLAFTAIAAGAVLVLGVAIVAALGSGGGRPTAPSSSPADSGLVEITIETLAPAPSSPSAATGPSSGDTASAVASGPRPSTVGASTKTGKPAAGSTAATAAATTGESKTKPSSTATAAAPTAKASSGLGVQRE